MKIDLSTYVLNEACHSRYIDRAIYLPREIASLDLYHNVVPWYLQPIDSTNIIHPFKISSPHHIPLSTPTYLGMFWVIRIVA